MVASLFVRPLLAGLLLVAPCVAFAAEPAGVVVGGQGQTTTLSLDDLNGLPSSEVSVSFQTEHGPRQAVYGGPLLWSVLERAHAIDPKMARQQVRLAVLVTGRDGYTAILAMGEISPEFEGKPVLLATRLDGTPLDRGQLRVVVPSDRRGGRSVQDVVRIFVVPIPAGQP